MCREDKMTRLMVQDNLAEYIFSMMASGVIQVPRKMEIK
jgi:hypothetical protein